MHGASRPEWGTQESRKGSMSEAIINPATDEVMRTAKDPLRRRVYVIIAFMVTMLGVVVVGAFNFGGKYSASNLHEVDQDLKIAANKAASENNLEAILKLSILSVHQGRYQEKIWRALAPDGREIPDRPEALNDIEREIFEKKEVWDSCQYNFGYPPFPGVQDDALRSGIVPP